MCKGLAVSYYGVRRLPPAYATRISDTTRLLAPSLADASTSEVATFVRWFFGTSECFELLFLQDYAGVATLHQHDDRIWTYVLATAVVNFGAGSAGWERFIRNLLRRGLPTHEIPDDYFRKIDGTTRSLLDCLFWTTSTPLEAEEAGDSWLQLLKDEGYDVVAYLENEMAIHAPNLHISRFSPLLPPRFATSRLVYNLRGNVRVSWDWGPDPTSSIASLQEDFKFLIYWPIFDEALYTCRGLEEVHWEWSWPFVHPTYQDLQRSLYDISYDDCDDRLKCKTERANRRTGKKAAKLARSQRSKGPRRVPGAWPI